MDAPLYVCLTIAAALFVLRDATRRRATRVAWATAAALAWPIALPLWLATRPLRLGERRAGGRAWNVLRSFVLTWTVLWGAHLVAMLGVGVVVAGTARSEADRASGLGMVVLMGVIYAVLWVVPAVGALLLGLVLRRPTAVEHGPGPAALPT